MIYDFAVIGGDMRQVYLANYLKNQRYQVITYATKKEGSECKEGKSFENVIREAKCMIGPVVFSKNGEITGSSSNKKMSVETLLQEMTKEQILFGGCINEEIRHECEQKEIKAFDFMKMDDVAIYNAIATAEGAIMEAIKMQPINLHKSRCLVLGYGRCAKVLAAKLKGMDAQVTVCARNKTARSLAKSFGLEVMDFTELKRRICQYDHIFNTVPKQILKEDILRKISKESCIIDIASYPGGTNHQMAEKLGIVTNPILIGIVAGLVWSALKIPMPAIPKKVISSIGNVATPMGLMAMGATFDIKKAFGKIKPSAIAAFMKLIGLCAIFLPIAVKLGFRTDKLVAILIMLGSATTVSSFVMAKNMGHEGTLSSSVVMLTTMFSAFTVTGWLYILRHFMLI